jgi:hypothetical protein
MLCLPFPFLVCFLLVCSQDQPPATTSGATASVYPEWPSFQVISYKVFPYTNKESPIFSFYLLFLSNIFPSLYLTLVKNLGRPTQQFHHMGSSPLLSLQIHRLIHTCGELRWPQKSVTLCYSHPHSLSSPSISIVIVNLYLYVYSTIHLFFVCESKSIFYNCSPWCHPTGHHHHLMWCIHLEQYTPILLQHLYALLCLTNPLCTCTILSYFADAFCANE